MLKIIIPTILILLLIFFWEKISTFFYEKFKLRLNYLILSLLVIGLIILIFLLYN